MTNAQNKRFFRWGLYFLGIFSFTTIAIANKSKPGFEQLFEYERLVELFFGASLFGTFIFLIVLGLFPIWLKFCDEFLLSERQKRQMDFFFRKIKLNNEKDERSA